MAIKKVLHTFIAIIPRFTRTLRHDYLLGSRLWFKYIGFKIISFRYEYLITYKRDLFLLILINAWLKLYLLSKYYL